MQLAKQLSVSKLIVELDAKVLVDLLNSKVDLMHSIAPIVCDCRSIMQTFHVITFKHVYREANQCADFWTKMDVEEKIDFILFDCYPLAISKLLELDCRSFALPRFVNFC